MGMIPEIYFNPTAPLWEGIRWRHDCSNKADLPLIVTRRPDGWAYYCHRCKERGIKRTDLLSPSEYKLWQEAKDAPVPEFQAVEKVELPAGFTQEISPEGLAWLYSHGLTDADIEEFSIGYSRVLNRVILPVYRKGELVYWQGRGLNPPFVAGKNPKYMNIKAKGREDIWFVPMDSISTDQIVLVEDIISAIRVHHAGYDCLGLLYAYIPDDLVMRLSKVYTEIVFWLDPDKWSRMMNRVKRWRAFGINVRSIRSDHDPKFYDEDEIIDHLEV
jgi:hypothetical protein